MNVSEFLSSVKNWAKINPDISALILVGSYARGEARPDSDIDLVIITSKPKIFTESHFMAEFGEVLRFEVQDWGSVTSLRTWYADSLEVEFSITSPLWIQMPLDSGTHRVLSDGYQVLVDKKDLFTNLSLKI